MTSATYWGWQAITAVLRVLGCKSYFPPAGHHFSLFHPLRSGNENDVPYARGKNSPPWWVRGATQRANCLNEIPVHDEWEERGLLGSQASAAACLCPCPKPKTHNPLPPFSSLLHDLNRTGRQPHSLNFFPLTWFLSCLCVYIQYQTPKTLPYLNDKIVHLSPK